METTATEIASAIVVYQERAKGNYSLDATYSELVNMGVSPEAANIAYGTVRSQQLEEERNRS
jgi:hypothetical protein